MKIGKKRIYSGENISGAFGRALISGDTVIVVSVIDPFVHVSIDGENQIYRVPKGNLKKIQKSIASDSAKSHTPPPRELYCRCVLNPIAESTVPAQDSPAGSINFGSAIAPVEKTKDQADKIIGFLDAGKNSGDTVSVMADTDVNLYFSDSIEDTAKKYGIPFSGMYCSGADGKPKQEPNTEKYALQIKQLRSAADMIESGLYSPEKIIIELKNSED